MERQHSSLIFCGSHCSIACMDFHHILVQHLRFSLTQLFDCPSLHHTAAAHGVLAIWHQHNKVNHTTCCHTRGPYLRQTTTAQTSWVLTQCRIWCEESLFIYIYIKFKSTTFGFKIKKTKWMRPLLCLALFANSSWWMHITWWFAYESNIIACSSRGYTILSVQLFNVTNNQSSG